MTRPHAGKVTLAVVAQRARLRRARGPLLEDVPPHDGLPLGLRDLELAHPEPATDRHPGRLATQISPGEALRPPAHGEFSRRAPAEDHPERVVVALLAGACQLVGVDLRG